MAFKVASRKQQKALQSHLPNQTIASVTPVNTGFHQLPFGRGPKGALQYAAACGWVFRSKRKWLKVVRDENGNVTFGNTPWRAVFGHRWGLEHCQEYSRALIKLFIEGEVG